MRRTQLSIANYLLLLLLSQLCFAKESLAEEPALKVCTTTPDLAALVREIGGRSVDVVSFTKGAQDPHHLEARPSFIRRLKDADLFVQVGLGLEVGWAPVLLRSARNSETRPGSEGFLDVSMVISPLGVPEQEVDRSHGDVHAEGNPHYLLDPLNGLKVARVLRDRLIALRPGAKGELESNYDKFRTQLLSLLLGDRLPKVYVGERLDKLLKLLEKGGPKRFLEFLDSQGQRPDLGGWLALASPYLGAKVISDHDLWLYLGRWVGIDVQSYLEPKPGISPTTKHLAHVIRTVKAQKISVILSAPYFDPRHANFVSRHTGAQVVAMAHQVGAREGADSYLRMLDYNARRLVAAFGGGQ